MHFFEHPAEQPAQPPPEDAVRCLEVELQIIEAQYAEAEEIFDLACQEVIHHKRADAVRIENGRAIVRVKQMKTDPIFAAKCGARARALRHRNELLKRRGELLHQLGRI